MNVRQVLIEAREKKKTSVFGALSAIEHRGLLRQALFFNISLVAVLRAPFEGRSVITPLPRAALKGSLKPAL